MQYSLLFRGVAGLASVGALSSWLGLVPGMESFAGYNPLADHAAKAEVTADAGTESGSESYVARYQASGSLSDGLPALPNSFPQGTGAAVSGSPAAPPNLGGLGLPPLDQADATPPTSVVAPGNALQQSPVLPQTPAGPQSSFADRYTSGSGNAPTNRIESPSNELRSVPGASPVGTLNPRNASGAVLPPHALTQQAGGQANLNSRSISNPNALQQNPNERMPNSLRGQPRSLPGQTNYEAAQAQLRQEQGGGPQAIGGLPSNQRQQGTPASAVAYDSNGRLRNFDQKQTPARNAAAGSRLDPRSITTGAPFVSPPPARGRYATSPYDHGLFMNAAYQRRAVAVDPQETSAVSNRGPGQLASSQAPLTGRENLPQYQQNPAIYPTAYQCNPGSGVALGAPTLPPPGNVPGQNVPPTLTPNLAPGLYSANNNGYSPLLSLGQEGYNVQIGRGIVGQPTVYVPGQPVRNFLRYLSP
ncbi:MAG: hypothetical protein ACE361_13995 [Aureliella sp.]